MRIGALAFAILGVALAWPAARAQTRPGFELGPELSYYTYRESGVNYIGPMVGLQGSWTWNPSILFLRLEATGDVARVDYSSSLTGNTNNIMNLKGEARALIGSDMTLRPGLVLTPYAGIGYRALYDMQGGTDTNSTPQKSATTGCRNISICRSARRWAWLSRLDDQAQIRSRVSRPGMADLLSERRRLLQQHHQCAA